MESHFVGIYYARLDGSIYCREYRPKGRHSGIIQFVHNVGHQYRIAVAGVDARIPACSTVRWIGPVVQILREFFVIVDHRRVTFSFLIASRKQQCRLQGISFGGHVVD